ncbi:putative tripartite motif protein [Leishmania guyanensis]
MAKRTLGRSAVEGDHSGKTGAPDECICSSSQDEEETFQACPAPVAPLSEETIAAEAAPKEVLGAPISWPFLCPLCSAVELVDPVDLHEPVSNTSSLSSCHSRAVEEALHCLACRACVERWLSAVRAVNESKAATMDHSSSTSGSAASSTLSPLSTSASCCASLLACPLCNAMCDAAVLSSACLAGDVAGFCDASVVRNSYTDSQPSPCTTQAGGTVRPPSAPAGSASPCCSICEEARATCVCMQCDFGMCDACHRATHSKGGFRQHEVLGVEQARRRGHLRCTQHAGMVLDLFCDTCSTCVCVTCCFGGAHRGHEVFPLADVAARTAAALTQHSTELAALQRDADAIGTQLAALWPAYETKVDAVRTEIQQCFTSLRQALQEREDALLARLGEVSAEVGRRSSGHRNAMHAISSLLCATGTCLRSLPGSVSAVTLMRIFDAVQQHEEWVSRMSTRVIEEATTVAEGWDYHMGSDSANGCRMVSFVLLNTDTPNDDDFRQYRRVLSDLGRLHASADVHLPLAKRHSTTSLAASKGHNERVEGQEVPPRRGGITGDYTVPSDSLIPGAPAHFCGVSYASSGAVAITEEDEEALVARSSHLTTVIPPVLLQTASSRSADAFVATRNTELCASRQRSMSASTVQSQPKPLHLSPINAPSQSTYGPLCTYELNVESPLKGPGVAASSSAAAGTLRLNGVPSKWSGVKQNLQEANARGSFAVELGTLGRHQPGCTAAAAARSVRDTIPFRVSFPPRRMGSYDLTDEDGRTLGKDGDQMPWRALKLHRNSSVHDDVRSAATSLPLHKSTTRLQYFTELDLRKPSELAQAPPESGSSTPKRDRAESQRRTTGLQLEL